MSNFNFKSKLKGDFQPNTPGRSLLRVRDKHISYALNMLLGWMFALSLMIGLVYLTILDTSLWDMAVMTFLGVLAASLVLYNKFTLAGFTAALCIFTFFAYRSLTGDEPSYFLIGQIYSLNQTWLFMSGEIGFTWALNDSTLRLIAFGISILSAVLMRLKFSYPVIFAVGAGVFLSVNIATPYGRHSAFFLLLLALFLIFIKRAKNSPKRVLILAPVCAAVIFLASITPMPDVTAGRRFLEDVYEDIYWIVREPFMPRYFSAGWLGFEMRDGRLGGNLNQSGDFIMWVFADEPVYLAALTQNIYTGQAWMSHRDEEEFIPRIEPDFTGMRNFELDGYLGNTLMVFDDNMGYAAQQRRLVINIGRARTGTIFRPPNTLRMNIYGDYEILQRGMDLRVAPVFRRNAVYSFIHYTVDMEDPFIQEALLNSHRGFYEAQLIEMRQGGLEAVGAGYTNIMDMITSTIFENIRIPYAQYVHANYTSLPVTLPDRVAEHTFTIVEGYETDFERATAIMNYLRSIPYSLTPGDVPYDRDFVDYFLFDVREGYCTYHATAMAVMARIIGIPSRYNIGFMLPEQQAGDGFFAVFGVNAHAWAELYFEGVGWVVFEATPPYLWNLPYDGSPFEFPSEWDDWWIDEYYEMEWMMYLMGQDIEVGTAMPVIGPQTQERTDVNPLIVVIVAAALALGSYMFIRKAEEDKRHRIIRGDEYRQSVLEGFKGLVELLDFYGLPMNPYESSISYAKRIEKMAPLAVMQLRTAAEIFSRARYSEIEINQFDANFIKNNYFNMYGKIKESGGKFKFFIHRYVKKLKG
ncbi:MAG: transglutaminase-like domain-containing protein [Defluviitaleaceae bacterium]|nr:transglutaminase-like domain-containing protein [Defluviitaleaceae bacterium]